MSSSKVRADYEQLQMVADQFGSQAQATRQTLWALQQQLAVLVGGDWLGQGASAFYQEMDSSVLPTFHRMIDALDKAANVTSQIGAVMKDAEDQAARVLRGDGTAQGSRLSSAPGVRTSAFGGVPGPGPGSPMPAPSGGSSFDGPAARRTGGVADPAASDAIRPSDEFMAQFDIHPGMKAAIQKSPTLLRGLYALEKTGWQVAISSAERYTTLDRKNRLIVVGTDDGQSGLGHIYTLSRSLGEFIAPKPQWTDGAPDVHEDEFVRTNVNESFQKDGSALLTFATARQEIYGDADTGWPVMQHFDHYGNDETQELDRVYRLFQSHQINREQAIQQMGDVVGNHKSDGVHSEWELRARYYQNFWDARFRLNGWGTE